MFDSNHSGSGGCPDENVFARRVAGDLSAEEARQLEDHVAGCRMCERLLADLGMMESAGGGRGEATLGIGAELGRYVVRGVLGAGAMGVVYEGYDPELHRRVALKILRPERTSDPEVARRRLLLEAQAMARLEHPNVISVHDVGVSGDLVFIAMALIEGSNARAWQDEASRSVEDTVRVYAEAARGLAAAHRAGLVHRDVKPDNILIHEDNRQVVVTDFGLAHAEASLDTGERETQPMLTETGMLLGTPRYMSPEQFDQASVGPASDQYSLCVSLFEALHGTHPFGAHETLASLQVAVALGRIEAPRRADVPRHVQTAIERGMALDPDARHPSMEALVEALSRAPSAWPRRLKTAALIGGALLVLGGGLQAWNAYAERTQVQACEAKGRAIEEVWNADVRRTVEQGFDASALAHAPVSRNKTIAAIAAYAADWAETSTRVCLATHVEQRWTADAGLAGTWCLAEQRTVLEVLIDQLIRPDDAVINRAVPSAMRLPRPVDCLDEAELARADVPTHAEPFLELRADVERVALLRALDRRDEAGALVRRIQQRSRTLGAPRLQLAVDLEAAILIRKDDPQAAANLLEAVYFAASELGENRLAAEAANELTDVVGFRLFRPEDGLRWNKHAESALAELGEGGTLLQADVSRYASVLLAELGRMDEAEVRGRQALESLEAIVGPNHPKVAAMLDAQGRRLIREGRHAEAATVLTRAVAILEECLGAQHPGLERTLRYLGRVREEQGEFAEAAAIYTRGVEIAESSGDPLLLAETLMALGWLRATMGDHEDAQRLLQRVVTITESSVYAGHPFRAAALGNLATVQARRHRYADARANFLEARSILEVAVGTDHPSYIGLLANLANVELDNENYEAAVPRLNEALAAFRAALGEDHPNVASTLASLGDAYRFLQQPDQARTSYESALAIFEKAHGQEHVTVIKTRVRLAHVARMTGATRRAEEAYSNALASLEAASLQEHGTFGEALRGLAEIRLSQRRAPAAIELAERAMALGEGDPIEGATSGFVLARALWLAGRRAEALSVVDEARAALPVDATGALVEAIEAWVEDHR